MLRGLVRVPVRGAARSHDERDLASRLAGRSAEEQHGVLLDLVLDEAAAALGHRSRDSVDPARGFLDQGFDSLMAVELRNRLGAVTGIRLSATLLFDHPSPQAVALYLRPLTGAGDPPGVADMDRLESSLEAIQADDEARELVAERLRLLLTRLDGSAERTKVTAGIDAASDEEIFDYIDTELGSV
jgi:acyl carrier protein